MEIDTVADKSLKRTDATFVVTDADRFRFLDLYWYEDIERRLRAEGFQMLKDVELLEHNKAFPTAPLFFRVMVSKDGDTMVGFYHYWDQAHPRELPTNDIHVVDVETELWDGTFLVTTNMPPQAEFDIPPTIDRWLVDERDPAEVVRAHRQHVAHYEKRNEDVRVRTTYTLEDVIAAQQRLTLAHGTYRQEMEIPATEDELNNATDHQYPGVVRAVSDVLRSWFPSGW